MPSTRPRLHLALLLAVAGAVAAAPRAQEDTASPRPRTLTLDDVLERGPSLRPQLPRVGWLPSQESWYLVTRRPDGQQAVVRHATAGRLQEEVVTAGQVRAAFADAGVPGLPENDLPPFGWVDDGTLRFELPDGIWHWKLRDPQPKRVLTLAAGRTPRAVAADDARGAWIGSDGDLWVAAPDAGTRRLTWDGSAENIVYGGAAHRAEFGITDGLWWDPTGRYLAFSREDQRPSAVYPYVDFDPEQPAPIHGRYPMAGDAHSRVTIGVYDSDDHGVCYLEHDPDADVYWTNVTFHPGGGRLWVALVNRGQNALELVEFDATTGKRLRVVLRESDPNWIEPEHGPVFVGDGGDRFLWFSSRDGYRHLYRYRTDDGTLIGRATAGPFDVENVVGIADDQSVAWIRAPGESPLDMHVWRIPLGVPGPGLERVSLAPGRHVCSIATKTQWLLDAYTAHDNPGTIELLGPASALSDEDRRTLGGSRRVIARAPNPLREFAVGEQEFYELEAADGSTLHGHLIFPPDFTPDRKWPILHYVYGGPHAQLVQNAWGGGARPWLWSMASRGYVVHRIDNRGTPHRGRAFEQAIFRRLGTVEVDDQVRALEQLKTRPWVDADRIGVHGWSFGGYMTLRLVGLHPQLFRAAVSGAPVTDWAQYETGYTERYMDTPAENPDGYAASSVLPLAKNLVDSRTDLLLVHGSHDQTVMLSHAMRFLDACVEAGAPIDFMTYPMELHGLRGKARAHFYRKMTRYFDDRLAPLR